jgi:hypothetical protein
MGFEIPPSNLTKLGVDLVEGQKPVVKQASPLGY